MAEPAAVKACSHCGAAVGKLRRGWCGACYLRARRVNFTHVPDPVPHTERPKRGTREPQEGGKICVVCEVPRTGHFTREACNACYAAVFRAGTLDMLPDPPKQREHGTSTRWKTGCRCTPCVKANSRAQQERTERNRRKLAEGTWTGKHGTSYSALDLGCRCELCAPVGVAFRRKYRAPSPVEAFEGIGRWTPIDGDVTVIHWPHPQLTSCPDCGEQLPMTGAA